MRCWLGRLESFTLWKVSIESWLYSIAWFIFLLRLLNTLSWFFSRSEGSGWRERGPGNEPNNSCPSPFLSQPILRQGNLGKEGKKERGEKNRKSDMDKKKYRHLLVEFCHAHVLFPAMAPLCPTDIGDLSAQCLGGIAEIFQDDFCLSSLNYSVPQDGGRTDPRRYLNRQYWSGRTNSLFHSS